MTVFRSTSVWTAAAWVLAASFVSAESAALVSTDTRCRDMLTQALAEKNPDARKEAVVALSLVASRFLPQLKQMLADADLDVRLAAVSSLAEARSAQATAILRTALDDEAPEVVFAAAKALWGLKDPAGRQVLMGVLGGESKTASGYFTKHKREALRTVKTPKVLLMFALQHGIGYMPVPYLGVGVSSMQEILSNPQGVSGRAAAALLLATDKDPATLGALKDALHDKDASVRAAAAHAVAVRADARLKPDLASLLDDEHATVRLRAAAGYLRMAGRREPAQDAATAAPK